MPFVGRPARRAACRPDFWLRIVHFAGSIEQRDFGEINL
jgi:hypothetical protein